MEVTLSHSNGQEAAAGGSGRSVPSFVSDGLHDGSSPTWLLGVCHGYMVIVMETWGCCSALHPSADLPLLLL